MVNSIIRYTALFIMLLLIQLLLMDNIQFSGFVNPYVYVLFIILLPLDIPHWLLLILAFVTGLVVDLASGIPGLHASAMTWTALARPYILTLIAPRDGYEQGDHPGLKLNGLRWFFLYIALMVLIHHTALFYLEVLRFEHFFRTLARVIISSLFTILFILLIQYVIIRR